MKTLFLVRHGKSSWADPNLADAQRPLKKRGHRQATALGPALRARGALGGRIVSSPAVRARETTRVMLDSTTGQEATSPEIQDALYIFSAEALLDWLQSQPPRSPLTIVGHNPALLGLANRLLNGRLEHLPTGAVVEITLPGQSWRQVGRQTAEKTALLLPEHLSYKLFKRKAPSPPPELSHSSLSRRIPASLAHQAQIILALEPGVRMGVDPEFLHQFRVNLRRSRAIAEALQRVEKNSTLKKATKGLKRQAQETSQLRDLDVFLETLSAWNEDPERAGLIQTIGLESIFRDRQQQEHERLCRVLDSDAYNHDIQR